MIKKIIMIVGLVASSHSYANFAECLIDGMPGTVNQPVFNAVLSGCRTKYPQGYFDIEKGSGRGIFGYKNRQACVVKFAKNTPFPQAAYVINVACGCLYEPSNFKGEKCFYPNYNN